MRPSDSSNAKKSISGSVVIESKDSKNGYLKNQTTASTGSWPFTGGNWFSHQQFRLSNLNLIFEFDWFPGGHCLELLFIDLNSSFN